MKLRTLLAIFTLGIMVVLAGCKGQQQMQQTVTDLDAKIAEQQRRVQAMDAELKKANFELNQVKGLVTKLGNVVVDLQKAEEERQRMAAEAKAKVSSSKSKKAPAKKRHR